MRLTKTVVDALAKAEGEAWAWDATLPGFGARRSPGGAISYVVQYRAPGGQTRRMKLGRHGPLTPEAARKLAQQYLGAVAAGRDPAEERRAARESKPKPTTLAEIVTRWQEHQAARAAKGKLRARTLSEYSRQLRAEILPRLGRRKLEEITRADVQALHDALADRPVLANRTLDLLSAVWRWAELQDLTGTRNPCRAIDRNLETRRARHLTHEELTRLGAALRNGVAARSVPPRVEVLVRLIALTGCRPGEIKSLAWRDVDLRRCVLHLRDAKTGDRDVWLAPPAKVALERLQALPLRPGRKGRSALTWEASPWCFPSPRDLERPVREFRKPWTALLEAARIEHVEPYVLRHTFASEAEALGLSPYLTAELLGHTTRRRDITRGYVHHIAEDVRRGGERVAECIAAALDGREPAP